MKAPTIVTKMLGFGLLIGSNVFAQNVGIGTSTPNPKAALEIKSTSKGLLIPSMTTSQRFAITTPPSGLMVYDTDKNEFYHYNGSGWNALLNGTYWSRPITARSRIANTTDSVGIGTVSPTEWLDVDGNIKARNNLLADNNIVVKGDMTIIGSSLQNGTMTTNADIVMNGAGPTLQLKNNSANTGFFQISGNNVRLGTNSGNTEGKLIIRNNGADRLSVDADGNINITGKLTKSTKTSTASLTPICFGRIGPDGKVTNSGTRNFSVTKTGTGQYEVVCQYFEPNAIIVANPVDFRTTIGPYYFGEADSHTIKFYTYDLEEGIYMDSAFSFIVYE